MNDTYGHDIGDHVLLAGAHNMVGAVRNADMLARKGGNEFVAVLPDVPEATIFDG